MSNDELSCQDFVDLVTEYLEGTLAPAATSRFEQHVDECPGCQNYLDQMRSTLRVLGSVRFDTLTAAARQDLLTAFRSWRDDRRPS